jgi:hypothetical protein
MFKVGDRVKCVDDTNCSCITEGEIYEVVSIPSSSKGSWAENLQGQVWVKTNLGIYYYPFSRFKLVDPLENKHYFVNAAEFNDNRTLMTEEEAMEYLRKNGGGTLYKKVLTMRIKTKTVEEIEKYG